MTKLNTILTSILGLLVILSGLLAVKTLPQGPVFGSAPSGLAATIATTSQALVGATVTRLFATSTACSARVITTGSSQIHLTFSEYNNVDPSATFGHRQLASTTVEYDAGIYGCNSWRVYGFGADTITVTETR